MVFTKRTHAPQTQPFSLWTKHLSSPQFPLQGSLSWFASKALNAVSAGTEPMPCTKRAMEIGGSLSLISCRTFASLAKSAYLAGMDGGTLHTWVFRLVTR